MNLNVNSIICKSNKKWYAKVIKKDSKEIIILWPNKMIIVFYYLFKLLLHMIEFTFKFKLGRCPQIREYKYILKNLDVNLYFVPKFKRLNMFSTFRFV